jgi:hypothetical protein
MMVSMSIRGLVVMILSFSISAIHGEGDGLTEALVFLSAIFPQTAINYIATVARSQSPNFFEGGNAFPEVKEIDLARQAALREHNIANVGELATADLPEVLEAVGMDPLLLIRAADRALLVYVLGVGPADQLASIPLYTATDLVLFVRGSSCFWPRWQAQGESPPPIVAQLDISADEQQTRLQIVLDTLQVKNLTTQLAMLDTNQNFLFILDQRVRYGLL